MTNCRSPHLATQTSMSQRADFQIQVAELPGSMLTGVTFYCRIFFCFHVVKPLMPFIEVLPISANLQKTAKKGETFHTFCKYLLKCDKSHYINGSTLNDFKNQTKILI